MVTNNFNFREMASSENENPIPIFHNTTESPIEYIVFISKENRTYDEVFGQQQNGNGDSTLARYARNVTFTNRSMLHFRRFAPIGKRDISCITRQ